MSTGIIVCGLNGSGKSTLGKRLAEKLGFYFIDNEDMYFSKTDPNNLYSISRSREEADTLLMGEVKRHKNFVLTAVKGDYGEELLTLYKYAVLIEAPREVRLKRIRLRSYGKFGERMLPGGELYGQEKDFYDRVSSRPEDYVEKWICSLTCPVIRIDGTKPIEENIELIVKRIYG